MTAPRLRRPIRGFRPRASESSSTGSSSSPAGDRRCVRHRMPPALARCGCAITLRATSGSAPAASMRPWSCCCSARQGPGRARSSTRSRVARPARRVSSGRRPGRPSSSPTPTTRWPCAGGTLARIEPAPAPDRGGSERRPGPGPRRRPRHRQRRARQPRPRRPAGRSGRPVPVRDDGHPLCGSRPVAGARSCPRAGPAARRGREPPSRRRRRPSRGAGRRGAPVRRGRPRCAGRRRGARRGPSRSWASPKAISTPPRRRSGRRPSHP